MGFFYQHLAFSFHSISTVVIWTIKWNKLTFSSIEIIKSLPTVGLSLIVQIQVQKLTLINVALLQKEKQLLDCKYVFEWRHLETNF